MLDREKDYVALNPDGEHGVAQEIASQAGGTVDSVMQILGAMGGPGMYRAANLAASAGVGRRTATAIANRKFASFASVGVFALSLSFLLVPSYLEEFNEERRRPSKDEDLLLLSNPTLVSEEEFLDAWLNVEPEYELEGLGYHNLRVVKIFLDTFDAEISGEPVYSFPPLVNLNLKILRQDPCFDSWSLFSETKVPFKLSKVFYVLFWMRRAREQNGIDYQTIYAEPDKWRRPLSATEERKEIHRLRQELEEMAAKVMAAQEETRVARQREEIDKPELEAYRKEYEAMKRLLEDLQRQDEEPAPPPSEETAPSSTDPSPGEEATPRPPSEPRRRSRLPYSGRPSHGATC